jgi:hypothetical protein
VCGCDICLIVRFYGVGFVFWNNEFGVTVSGA